MENGGFWFGGKLKLKKNFNCAYNKYFHLFLQFWPSLVGNCQLDRDIGGQIKNSGLFKSVNITNFSANYKMKTSFVTILFAKLIEYEIYGWAMK